jgi:hypothetical protein
MHLGFLWYARAPVGYNTMDMKSTKAGLNIRDGQKLSTGTVLDLSTKVKEASQNVWS